MKDQKKENKQEIKKDKKQKEEKQPRNRMKDNKENKKESKKENKSKKIIIISIITILILLICAFVGIYFYNKNKDNESKNALNIIKIDETKITEEKTERILQLEELQKENEEIVAWIEIEGTNINYPVLQSKDNDYYMTHNYKKEYSKDGSIFLDKDYDWSIPSSNLLMYGHNNKNGTMFQDLMNYKQEQYYNEHPIVRLTTNKEDAKYEIIAVFLSRVYYKSEKNVFRYYYFINAQTKQEYDNYVEDSKKSSLYDTGKTAEYGDQLLTLSTCAYHTEDGRFVVVARKIK